MNAGAPRRIGVTMRVVDAVGYDEPRDALAHDWTTFMRWAAPEVSWLPIPNRGSHTVDYAREFGVDALILSGGNDVGDSEIRDASERALLTWCFETGRHVLGVCRGLQMLQTYFGGGLCAREEKVHVACRHEIRTEGAPVELPARLTVNSFHAHGVARDQLATPLRAFAWSEDGGVEAALGEQAVGIMWHPERETPFASHDHRLVRYALGLKEAAA